MTSMLNFKNLKYLFIPFPISINTYQNRQHRTLHAYSAISTSIIRDNQPATLNGHFSWLTHPTTDQLLSLDIFYPRIDTLAGIDLADRHSLIVETLSSVCTGQYDAEKAQYFSTEQEFVDYADLYSWKREQILGRRIPLLELNPDNPDELSPYYLRKRIGALLDVIL